MKLNILFIEYILIAVLSLCAFTIQSKLNKHTKNDAFMHIFKTIMFTLFTLFISAWLLTLINVKSFMGASLVGISYAIILAACYYRKPISKLSLYGISFVVLYGMASGCLLNLIY